MNLGLGLGHRLGGFLALGPLQICLVSPERLCRGIIDHRQPR